MILNNFSFKIISLVSLFGLISCVGQPLKLDDIRVRDPFIFADKKSETYYLYAQMQNNLQAEQGRQGVEVYTSKDLKNWEEPRSVFEMPENFWGNRSVWAPEVHKYKEHYYLFVTFTSNDTLPFPGRSTAPQYKRGTQILKSKNPDGPFELISEGPQTPNEWMSLDGSLWVEDKVPYMIFCHEWAQIKDGTVDIVRLSDDLSKSVSVPIQLFSTTDIPWVKSLKELGHPHHGYVTDGNYVYQSKSGNLIMIWSTFGPEGYALIQAVSRSGSVFGPWEQIKDPIFKKDGGHGMIFKDLEGRLMLTFHQPNSGKKERAQLFEISDLGDRIALKRNAK